MKKAKKEILDIGFVDHDKLVKSDRWTAIGFIGLALSGIALVIGDSIRSNNTGWAKPLDDAANETNKKMFNMIKENIISQEK